MKQFRFSPNVANYNEASIGFSAVCMKLYVPEKINITPKAFSFQYEGVIQKGSENLVHHMEVFHCEVESNEIVRYYSGPGQAEGKPPELEACRKVIGAWAMGASV